MEIPLTYSNLHHPSAITSMAPFFSCALNLTCPNHDPVTIYTLLDNNRTYMSTNYRFMSTTYLSPCQEHINYGDMREPSISDNLPNAQSIRAPILTSGLGLSQDGGREGTSVA